MVKLWRCVICGDPYTGGMPPPHCPFCGAHQSYIREAREAIVNFDVTLGDVDRANAERALEVEVSNSSFFVHCLS
jgi:hypothetical protein